MESKPLARQIEITDDSLIVDLQDGRTLSVPLVWFPRLLEASSEDRQNWRFIGGGFGVHWEKIDEDLSVQGLLTMTGPLQNGLLTKAS